jgi:dolichol-phosphate mannosyltransferase
VKALVTGAAGFVGANLVRRLVADGHQVTAVVRPESDLWRLADVRDAFEELFVNLEDAAAVEEAVIAQQPEVIFHLAAHGAYSWQQDLDRMLAVNMRAAQALLNAAVRLDARVVNAGSSSEYGDKDHPPTEDEAPEPNSLYAVTKLGATHLCQLAAERHGARVTTLRLYSVYGPWEEPGRLMPTLVKAASAGGWPPLVGPDTARDFVWIDDACEAFLAATSDRTEPGAVFNIASGRQTTLAELVNTAAEIYGVTLAPEWGTMSQRAWDTSVWVGDPGRARQKLGWAARTSLSEGLAAFGDWLGENPMASARY